MNRAIVLLSGGMDSLVCAATAVSECDEVYFLHFSYGQRTQEKELECFNALVEHYQPQGARVVDYHWLQEIGGSALTDSSLNISSADISPTNNGSKTLATDIPNTYVPFRNATMLCAAVAWAEVIEATRIYIGAVEEDSSGYPDCREVFYKAFEGVIATGTKNLNPIRIFTPVLHLNKAEIVQKGMQLKAPFQLSWSCYVDNEASCGVCDSCILRLRAFAQAHYTDPIPYRKQQNLSSPEAINQGL